MGGGAQRNNTGGAPAAAASARSVGSESGGPGLHSGASALHSGASSLHSGASGFHSGASAGAAPSDTAGGRRAVGRQVPLAAPECVAEGEVFTSLATSVGRLSLAGDPSSNTGGDLAALCEGNTGGDLSAICEGAEEEVCAAPPTRRIQNKTKRGFRRTPG